MFTATFYATHMLELGSDLTRVQRAIADADDRGPNFTREMSRVWDAVLDPEEGAWFIGALGLSENTTLASATHTDLSYAEYHLEALIDHALEGAAGGRSKCRMCDEYACRHTVAEAHRDPTDVATCDRCGYSDIGQHTADERAQMRSEYVR